VLAESPAGASPPPGTSRVRSCKLRRPNGWTRSRQVASQNNNKIIRPGDRVSDVACACVRVCCWGTDSICRHFRFVVIHMGVHDPARGNREVRNENHNRRGKSERPGRVTRGRGSVFPFRKIQFRIDSFFISYSKRFYSPHRWGRSLKKKKKT